MRIFVLTVVVCLLAALLIGRDMAMVGHAFDASAAARSKAHQGPAPAAPNSAELGVIATDTQPIDWGVVMPDPSEDF
ncbi:hypothetical protein ACSFA2_25125 [Variovorax sp. LT2P21]|uniref:hypothetical protein n=1 Tax=Variovorax sp. LT2P21 TaxID=3443731 RepID=UPI003F46FDAA